MSRLLDDLTPAFKPLAIELIARCVECGIMPCIVSTGRTAVEQAEKLASGLSKVKYSKHQDGLAIDLAPYETFQMHGGDKINWDAGSGPESVKATWLQMGKIGEALGLRWGGRWHDPFDPGHFEYVPPAIQPTQAAIDIDDQIGG